jgi:hypothetical protein
VDPINPPLAVKTPVLGTKDKFDLANGFKVVGNDPALVPKNG